MARSQAASTGGKGGSRRTASNKVDYTAQKKISGTRGPAASAGVRKAAAKKGAEGPKRSIAGGMGAVTRSVPGGGRKRVGPKKSQAALMALFKESAPKKRGK